MLSEFLIPWGFGCVLGYVAAIAIRGLLKVNVTAEGTEREAEYRFSIRGMLICTPSDLVSVDAMIDRLVVK